MLNKRKIFNDPVYGFITIPYDIVYDIIQHPYFQRLRRIQQLGLSSMVYPGATHSRFHHSLGAMHLMQQALEVLKLKGVKITQKESEAATVAILLHDIGHAPFSHSLEYILVKNISHETISKKIIEELIPIFGETLAIALQIFNNSYKKKFLHQLVSGQLDMDRMDYLNRDSFYTGVSEGVIGYDRIINMLNVVDDNIVVEEKGIYSIEKFLIARRLMYWQVYLHKTSLVADLMLKATVERAIAIKAIDNISKPLAKLIENPNRKNYLKYYTLIDDIDIMYALKIWSTNKDKILAQLADAILNRKLFHLSYESEQVAEQQYLALKQQYSKESFPYLVYAGSTQNNAYNPSKETIKILKKDGSIVPISEYSKEWNLQSITQTITKHYIAYPKK
ncbi:MAG: HD domain-containing protein [Chitinophagales bacterium]|nr:HD domain-containing protein [Chitinophagales bacterium]